MLIREFCTELPQHRIFQVSHCTWMDGPTRFWRFFLQLSQLKPVPKGLTCRIYGTSEVAVNFIVTLDDTPIQLYKASCTVSIGPDGKGICVYLWSIRIALKSGLYPSGNTWALDNILRYFFLLRWTLQAGCSTGLAVCSGKILRYPASVFNVLNPLEGVRLTIFPHKDESTRESPTNSVTWAAWDTDGSGARAPTCRLLRLSIAR